MQAQPRLEDVWLRFHETEICQDLDAHFVFHKNGMEVWCLIEDEKSYQKFADMVSPLRASFQIDVYATHPPASKRQPEAKEPPPSLWNNAELLSYLKDPFSGNFPSGGISGQRNDYEMRRDDNSKQRLLLYADQIQDWRRRLQRYGTEIPALAQAGFGAGYAPDQKRRAQGISLAHLQALDKYADRLLESLSHALPRPAKRPENGGKADLSRVKRNAVEIASQLSDEAMVLSRRIDRFLYPQDHTVELTDLREPSLLESLRSLREHISDFQKAALAK